MPLVTSFGMYRLRSNALDDPEAVNALAHAIERMTLLQTLEWVHHQHRSYCLLFCISYFVATLFKWAYMKEDFMLVDAWFWYNKGKGYGITINYSHMIGRQWARMLGIEWFLDTSVFQAYMYEIPTLDLLVTMFRLMLPVCLPHYRSICHWIRYTVNELYGIWECAYPPKAL